MALVTRRMQAWPEERLGRITRAGRWDLRYRPRQAEPAPVDPMVGVARFLSMVIGAMAFLVGVLSLVAIGVPS